MEKDLLYTLSKLTKQDFISDMKYLCSSDEICYALTRILEQEYPLNQWNDAVNYLTETTKRFDSALDAKKYLIHRFEKVNG